MEFILILDRSGSMSGQPWSQVQTAVAKIVEMVKENPRIKTKIMVYNDTAQFLKSTGESAAIEVKTIRDLQIKSLELLLSVILIENDIREHACS